jgi:hypothetical protein
VQEEIFKRRADSVLLSLKEGRFTESCLKCRLLRQELFAEGGVEPEQLGILRLLELESFFGAGQYAEARTVLCSGEAVPFFLPGAAQSRMLYLGMELFFKLSEPLSMIVFARRFLRWRGNEEEIRLRVFRTLCDNLEIIGYSHLNFIFSSALLLFARARKKEELFFYALGKLAACYRQKKLPSVHNFLSRELADFLAFSKEPMPGMELLFEELQSDMIDFSSLAVSRGGGDSDFDPHYVNPETGRGSLHEAVFSADKSLINLALSMGADIDLPDGLCRTPLHWSVMQAKPELIGLLLDAGAQTNFRDVNGFTPLFYARMQPDNPELAQLLLSHGAENR